MRKHNFKRLIKRALGYEALPPYVGKTLPGKNILVLAPHPDDEVLGCGGSLSKLDKGQKATIIFLTEGDGGDPKGENRDIVLKRKEEARKVWRDEENIKLVFMDFKDGKLGSSVGEAVERVEEYAKGADLILSTSPGDRHPDHVACAKVGATIGSKLQLKVMFYEVWSTLPVNFVIDITDVVEEKKRKISSYQSQMNYQDLSSPIIGLNSYRSIDAGDSHIKYAEGFLLLSRKEVEDLTS